jgi:cellobiose transport system permease protein
MKNTRIMRVLLISFLTLVSLTTIVPFYIMLIMGTYYSNDLFRGIIAVPGTYLVENMKTILASDFFRFYFNSFYIACSVTVLALLVSAMSGYAFSIYTFRLKKAVFNFVLATMMIPTQLGLIAFVWEMKELGILNTHLPLIIPPVASAFGVFWLTQYFNGSLPREVIESARIDGAGEFRTFFQIALPFVKPALTSLGLLFFLWTWNNYLTPLVVVSKESLYTVPLGINVLSQLYRTDYGAQILGLSIGTIPIIVLFVVFSRSFISGLTAVAVKG